MISIILPTRNRSDDLAKVLPSYLVQKHLLEILIMDDSTRETCRGKNRLLARTDSRCVLIQEGPPLGLTGAKNRGIQLSRGEYVFFGEDDLILEPDHLQILWEHRQRHNADIIGGRKIWLQKNEGTEEAQKRTRNKTGSPFDRFFIEFRSDCPGLEDQWAPFLQTNALIKKTVFEKARFDEDYVGFTKGYCWREETDFYLSANSAGFKVFFCPHTASFNLPTRPGGTHHFGVWKREWWVLKNNYYLLRKHKAFLRTRLNNRYPIFLLWSLYFLRRLYHQGRNLFHSLQRQ